jgi:putative FmdB family regulatory protein
MTAGAIADFRALQSPDMPIYEYACTACGERTEAKQGFDDPPLEVCPVCGGRLRKLFSPVGIVFKGSGFYATDAKRSRSKETTRSSSKDSDSSDSRDKKKESKDSSSEKSSSAKSSSEKSSKDKSA